MEKQSQFNSMQTRIVASVSASAQTMANSMQCSMVRSVQQSAQSSAHVVKNQMINRALQEQSGYALTNAMTKAQLSATSAVQSVVSSMTSHAQSLGAAVQSEAVSIAIQSVSNVHDNGDSLHTNVSSDNKARLINPLRSIFKQHGKSFQYALPTDFLFNQAEFLYEPRLRVFKSIFDDYQTAYYKKADLRHSKIRQVEVLTTILNYKNKDLVGNTFKKVYKGNRLKVKRIIKQGLLTRFELRDGSYITANKHFVKILK